MKLADAPFQPESPLSMALNEPVSIVACYAAGELEEHCLGIKTDFLYTQILVEHIAGAFGTTQAPKAVTQLWPPAVTLMWKVLKRAVPTPTQYPLVTDIVEEATRISSQLAAIRKQSDGRPVPLSAGYQKLHNFCLVFSKVMSASNDRYSFGVD